MMLSDMLSQAISGSISGALESRLGGLGQRGGLRRGGFNPNQASDIIAQQLGPEVSERLREAMLGQLVSEWITTLTPGQFSVMVFATTVPNARLRVVLEFEDEAGYRWRRPDDGQPVRIEETQKLVG
jgi:hypothetical protein